MPFTRYYIASESGQVARCYLLQRSARKMRTNFNVVRLTAEFCDLFRGFDIWVGVSLDGDRAADDRHRRFRNDASSCPDVVAGIALPRRSECRRSYAGLLCTVDLASDPIAVCEECCRRTRRPASTSCSAHRHLGRPARTSGEWELTDSMKITYGGATASRTACPFVCGVAPCRTDRGC